MACAVFDRCDNPATSLKRVRLVDFQTLRGYEFALAAIIERTIALCREAGVHVLESIGSTLKHLCPDVSSAYRRRLQSWAYYYKPLDEDLARKLADPAVWAPSLYDGDASL